MVSNTRFAQIHLRLAQILAQPEWESQSFGGANILLLGDLLQVKMTV